MEVLVGVVCCAVQSFFDVRDGRLRLPILVQHEPEKMQCIWVGRVLADDLPFLSGAFAGGGNLRICLREGFSNFVTAVVSDTCTILIGFHVSLNALHYVFRNLL